VIIISPLVDEQHFEAAGKRGMVIVSYDRRATPNVPSEIDHITVNNFEAARMAATHLIENGHQRLAFATASGMTMSRHDKIDGFFSAVKDAGAGVSAQVLDGGQLDEYGDSVMSESGRALAVRIAADPQRPTGILAVNDLMALGLMAGFRDAGLIVPTDVSVVGMDGLFLSALSNPALTTVQLPVTDMAHAMVERVMARLTASKNEPVEQIFNAMLIKRESVAPWLKPVSRKSAGRTNRASEVAE
jgi:DNA-binding LacI/PurR family transcriptional regulator